VVLYANPSWRRSLWGASDGQRYAHLETETAFRGPFLIKVDDNGLIDSQANESLMSEVEGTTTIISIVPEGTYVEAGDIVCELESNELVNQQKQQEIAVNDARSLVQQAEHAIQIQMAENESLRAAAELAVITAELDLTAYRDGTFEQTKSQLTGQVALREEELVRAQENYEFTRRLVNKGLRPQNELDARRLAVQQAEHNLSSAEDELMVLEEYTYRRQMAELEALAAESGRELDRVILQGDALVAQLTTERDSLQTKLELEQLDLERFNRQIAACTLRAPQAGTVVYANLQSGRWGNENEQIRERATVQQRQAIINIPDNTKLKVDCNVHESMVGLIRRGLPVRILLDAKPGEVYNGTVHSISSVAQSGDWRNQDLRQYAVEVFLTDPPERLAELKVGLTAKAEIIVDSRQNVLQVPVQCVVGVGVERLAWVLTDNGPEMRTLTLGRANTSHIEIIDGIAEGEEVVQNPRTHFAAIIAERESKAHAEEDQQTTDLTEGALPAASAEQPAAGRGAGGGGGQGGAGVGAAEQPAAGEATAAGGAGEDPGAQMFAAADTDKDGKLSESEVQGPFKDDFATIDTDSDGGLTPEEIATYVQTKFGGGAGGGQPAADSTE
jgi:HlyD family secretion protein